VHLRIIWLYGGLTSICKESAPEQWLIENKFADNESRARIVLGQLLKRLEESGYNLPSKLPDTDTLVKLFKKHNVLKAPSIPADGSFKLSFRADRESLVSFVNSQFDKNYDADIVEFGYTNMSFVESDTLEQIHGDLGFYLDNDYYHFEFQTVYDETMIFRVFRYTANKARELAMSDAFNESINFIFPQPLVIYLEEHSKIADKLPATITVADQKPVNFTVPVVKLWNYDFDALVDKKWYLLIPFTLISYRKKFKLKDGVQKHKTSFIDAYKKLISGLKQLWEEGKISVYLKSELQACALHLARHFNDVYLYDERFGRELSLMEEAIKSYVQQIGEERENEGVRKVAVKLLKRGDSVDDTSKVTGISIKLLQELKEKLSV
jgi:hypothetical protein